MDNLKQSLKDKKCDYCNAPAIHRFKTGKRSYCCSLNVVQCPAIKKKSGAAISIANTGRVHSEETKEKIKKGNLGKIVSEETKQKQRKPKSEEHKRKLSIIAKNRPKEYNEKISKTLKRRYKSGEININEGVFKKGHKAWNKGKPRSEKTKEKIRKTRKERIDNGEIVCSIETRKKMSKQRKGGKRSEETKEKMRIAASGENSSQWRGGIASGEYCGVWLDKEFKQDLKDRDDNKCLNPDC